MKKSELIEFVKHQLNIELENDKNYFLNKKRNVLYTKINRNDENKIFRLLMEKGIRFESHLNGYYFIIL